MEIADWDEGSVILTGLPNDMTPARVRLEVEMKRVIPEEFPESIPNLLKKMVTYLCKHQQMTPIFEAKMTDCKNTIAFFLCAAYEHPTTHGEKAKRPRLSDSKPLPLAEWASVYYALVAEIRSIYIELKEVYGEDLSRGNTILHRSGETGKRSGSQPFTALKLAARLETFWKQLMDPRLVSLLDEAIRAKHVAGAHDKKLEPHQSRFDSMQPFKVEGLLDINAMTYEEIMEVLWTKHKPEIERKAQEDESRRLLLASCKPEVLEAGSNRSSSDSTRSDSSCKCNRHCDCRMNCDFQKNTCSCTNVRKQVRDLVDDTLKLEDGVCHGLGPSPLILLDDSPDSFEKYIFRTASSDKSQPKTPSHRTKDAMPLNFYGDISDHRYPTMQHSVQHLTPPAFPVPAASESHFPPRKPVAPRRINIDRSVSAEEYISLVQHPHATYQPYGDARSSSPTPVRPAASPRISPRDTITSTLLREVSNISGGDGNGVGLPLPLPDFISPPTRTKQRYVQAGGDGKLESRAEIPGPAFEHTASGAAIDKEELFRRLSDPEYRKQIFGESAANVNLAASPEPTHTETRGSVDSKASSTSSPGRLSKRFLRIFGRKSNESDRE